MVWVRSSHLGAFKPQSHRSSSHSSLRAHLLSIPLHHKKAAPVPHPIPSSSPSPIPASTGFVKESPALVAASPRVARSWGWRHKGLLPPSGVAVVGKAELLGAQPVPRRGHGAVITSWPHAHLLGTITHGHHEWKSLLLGIWCLCSPTSSSAPCCCIQEPLAKERRVSNNQRRGSAQG